MEGARVGSGSYSASFLFDGVGALSAVQLRPSRAPAGVAAVFDELVALLSSRYGTPRERVERSSKAGSWKRQLLWNAPDSFIDLSAWKTTLSDAHVLAIDFGSGAISPRDEGEVVLTYQRATGP
jgi:hypothetical protein